MVKPYARGVGCILSALTAYKYQLAQLGDIPVDEALVEKIDKIFEAALSDSKELGLVFFMESIYRARNIRYDNAIVVIKVIDDVCSRLLDELKSIYFLHIRKENVEYYRSKQLFGKEVEDIIPLISEDIAEAGKCFALNRYTACVFHLMRIMEVAVQIFGDKLGVQSTKDKNWHNIIDEINREIKKVPQKNETTKLYTAIAAHLYNIKVAWRNPTMHPKATYTEEEARSLLSAVKIFMKDLVKIL